MINLTFKFLITILLTSALISSKTFAQRTTPEKGDDLILIIKKQSASQNFIDFGRFLVEQGFTFKSKDKDFLTLTTDEKTVGNGGYKYTLSISFKDSLISIRPRHNYVVFGSSISNIQTEWIDWEYHKSKHSDGGRVYYYLEPILRKHSDILYFTN